MTATESLLSLIDDAVRRETRGIESAALAFSGGLDSSVLAVLLRKRANITLYVVGTERSHDLVSARRTAEAVDLQIVEIVIEEQDVRIALPDLIRIMGSRNPVQLSYELPLYFVASRCLEGDIFTGQGADELFGGYAKYRRGERAKASQLMARDALRLKSEGVNVEKAVASRFDKVLHCPYLDDEIFRFACALPVEEKINAREDKPLLRDVARILCLPGDVVAQPKKAVQYGSGIMKLMRTIAGKEGVAAYALRL